MTSLRNQHLSAIGRLMAKHDTTMKELSQNVLGRNHAYLQQWSHRGSGPLPEPERVKLAQRYDLDPKTLEPLPRDGVVPSDLPAGLCAISELRVEVSAGGGAVVESEDERDRWYFSREMLIHELGVSPNQAKVVQVRGDSMSPVLESYDRVLIDTADRTPSPPGIFVLYDGLGLVVKRVEHIPHSDPSRFVITSANPEYGRYELGIDELYIVGRAVWFARRL